LATNKSLFVYGTLRSGEAQHGLVAHLTATDAKTRGTLYHLSAGYPALQLKGESWVHGQILTAPDPRLLQILDVYEGVHEGLFQRVTTEALIGLVRHEVWVYAMKNPLRHKGKIIPGGRWRRAGWK